MLLDLNPSLVDYLRLHSVDHWPPDDYDYDDDEVDLERQRRLAAAVALLVVVVVVAVVRRPAVELRAVYCSGELRCGMSDTFADVETTSVDNSCGRCDRTAVA